MKTDFVTVGGNHWVSKIVIKKYNKMQKYALEG